jgi:signal transduction histidine kinase
VTALAVTAAAGWGLVAAGWLRGRRRDVLVARACHELRGPLTAARLGLALAVRGGGAGPLAAVENELARAGRALDDLAEAPGGGRAPDRPEPVDVAALVARTVQAWAPFAHRHGATLRLTGGGGEAWVWGDPVRLAQACGNLLANAAEHGGGDVAVAVRVRGRRVLVDVEDGGPGLDTAPGELARAGRHRRRERGHGLAVAAEVAARHGGRLAGAPSPRGARLVLDLPAADRADRVADGGP